MHQHRPAARRASTPMRRPWRPHIGAAVPNFIARTTIGEVDFAEWSRDSWVVIFCHPAALTPVCTSEISSLLRAGAEFRRMGVKILVLSASEMADNLAWIADLERLTGARADFPLASDPAGTLLDMLGLSRDGSGALRPVRKTIVVGPDGLVRLQLEYPDLVGRDTGELLRSIEALQTVEIFNVGTGADWRKGDECLVMGCSYLLAPFDGGPWLRMETSYMVYVQDPWARLVHDAPRFGSARPS